ncbi:MAG TPA: SIMPL domain-containing protein [Candidatus Nanopelagicales bacterium]|nr:SIMPL domain-containing protein [Candidatus Nanopelagicales bacterium]
MNIVERMKKAPMLAGVTLGLLVMGPAAALAQAPETTGAGVREERLISTEGYGEVRVRPDSFRTTIGVQAQAETLEQARNEVNTRMQRVTQAINRLRIPGLVQQTELLQISPVYNRPPEGEAARIVGYRASNAVSVTVRGVDQARLGDLAARVIDAGVSAGANDLRGISFFVQDPSEARRRALQEAVNDAERNARAMAQAAEVSLVGLHALQGAPEFSGGPMLRTFAMEAGAPSTPIEAGETLITSRVNASFTFRRTR